LQAFAAILLGTWACASYASFWIVADSAATQNWAGMRYSRQGQTAEALRSFRKAIEIDPHAIEARINEAGIYGKTLQSAKVRQLCEEVLREDPKNPEALMALGILAQSEGRSEQASKLLGQTAVLAPDHPLVWPIIGQVCMLKGTIPDAILAYRKALRITPASAPSVHANLGLLLAQSGQTQEAIAQYRQALSILPSYDAWKTDLAWILATHAGATSADGPEAVQLALQGCKTTASAEALEALAAAYARDQKYWEAVASARRGL
jgi:tetratricopeptide (TPR) repeat protein